MPSARTSYEHAQPMRPLDFLTSIKKKLGVDESNAWGDHFFVEALVKAVAGNSEAGW